MSNGYVYILTNKNNTTLYVGSTNDIGNRADEHRQGIYSNSFSKRYNLNKLVHYEELDSLYEAINRERQIKGWRRKWKDNLVSESNPGWDDRFIDIGKDPESSSGT